MPKDGLFTIGEFSEITGVGIHSLRYYDELGVLKPEYVDPVSNYRYYGFRQLSRIPAINLCKDAGISLSNFDSYISGGNIDYSRLIEESRRSLEHRISVIRNKQQELDQTETILSVESALRSSDELKIYLNEIEVQTIELDDLPYSTCSSDLFMKISSEAKRRGRHIASSFCGLIQTRRNGSTSLRAFLQADSQETAGGKKNISRIPAGEYLIRRTDSFGIDAASELFAESSDGSEPDTVISLAFLCDAPEPLCCTAALIS
jgi:DNA-binding transcriptional MerR regulator